MARCSDGASKDRETEASRGARDYPASLEHIHDPPPVLWLRGARTELARCSPAIAIVGARDASAYGVGVASRLAGELASRGVTIVSGLALGIDAAAHRGALAAGGDTVAVLGCGTDIVCPRRNAGLRREILARSCVVSELPAGTPPAAFHFPRRNRIISGLSLGVVVVEAGERSGSLVTARHALEQGRDVFAVPGAVGAPRSRGPHALLKAGAKLVESADDVLEEYPEIARCLGAPPTPVPEGVSTIVAALRERPDSADGLALRLRRQVTEILAELLDLELRGEVLRGPAGRFSAVGGAGSGRRGATGPWVDSPPNGG